jgi:hypothetical protein
VVFDRRTAASLISPGPDALAAVLKAINDPELTPVWSDDETLGWIFEDYNDADERKEMREHDAPRNARELAVRNQFFTPRWVVEFLTDNTLGRLWYDLSGGQTELAQSCRFLLKPSEVASTGCRDPRDLKILDPACGSGHFLLYVYDLLETIYREVWQGRHHRSPEWTPLWEEFADEQALQREIPRLILAHNLHGVDIDPRCIQEAGLALWLRAHRSWSALGVRAKDRPRIAKVNLVCAQALSDAPGLREKLRQKLKQPGLGKLVDTLFLRVAEMGVLLRVETAIKDTVESVKKEYLTWKRERAQLDLLGEVVGEKHTTLEDFAKLRDAGVDEEFWKDADKLLLQALEALADEAEDKDHYRSRLFAEEVRHELEFFDISRVKFDVILMNPPFGVPTESTEKLLFASYPDCGGDLFAMFYQRALEMLSLSGRVGAITNRTWLGLGTQEGFRVRVLERLGSVEALADLGSFVLNAQVEVAAAVISRSGTADVSAAWIRLLKTGRKADVLEDAVRAVAQRREHGSLHWSTVRRFHVLPAWVYGYWMSDELIGLYDAHIKLETRGLTARKGAESGDDPRHLRLAWEVSASEISANTRWLRLAKGGDYRHFVDDIHIVIRLRNPSGSSVSWRRGKMEWFGSPGVTWPHRTTSRLSVRVLPSGSAYGDKGPAAQCVAGDRIIALALLNSRPVYLLLSARLGAGDDAPGSASKSYEVSLIRDLPWPSLTAAQSKRLTACATDAVEIVRIGQIEDDDTGETVVAYALPPALLPFPDGTRPTSLEAATRARITAREDRLIRLSAIQAKIDSIVADAYGFSERDRQVMDEELEPPLASLPGTAPIDEAQFRTAYLTKEALDGAKLPGPRWTSASSTDARSKSASATRPRSAASSRPRPCASPSSAATSACSAPMTFSAPLPTS